MEQDANKEFNQTMQARKHKELEWKWKDTKEIPCNTEE